jgi:hypothetical protein
MRFTRREFGKVAALGAVSRMAPPLVAQQERPFRYCIVGLGRISLQHFMPGTKLSQHCRVTALVTGHR